MAFGYGDARFSWGDHICTVFEDHDQQMAVMVPFITHGLRAGQRCVWISPPASAEAFRKAVAGAGVDTVTAEAASQLIIVPDVEFYLSEGIFDPERTIELGVALLEDGQHQGYSAMRVAADLSWLAGDPIDAGLWEGYEGQVTSKIAGTPIVAVCQYDHRRFSGSLIVTALHTHPFIILGDTVLRNPMFRSVSAEALGRPDVI